MNSMNNMNSIIIVGFNSDYAQLDVIGLSQKYDVYHLSMPAFLISLLILIKDRVKWLFTFICQSYFKFKLATIQGKMVLVCDDNVISVEALQLSCKAISRKILILRNTYKPELIEINLKDIDYYSFDVGDCNKYGFLEYSQYCSGFDYICKNKGKRKSKCVDFYFLGLNKGRRNILNVLEKKLSNYTTKIDIKERPTGFKKLSNRICKEDKYQHVGYCSHLDNILACNVVIDIVKEGQSGLTMRAIEAILAGKKIITNNKNIKNEPFYNAKNIMVIDEDANINTKEIDCFMNNDAVDFDESVLNNYSVVNVFQSILN